MFHNAKGNSKVLIREYVSDGFAGDPDSWKMISQFEETGADLIEYELGTVLSFEAEATGNRYAVEGFGMNAGTRTLLYGPYAELRIPIGNLPSEGNLTVSIGFKNRKDDVHKRFTVMANGQTVYAGETDKTILKKGLDVSVPAASFKNGNVLNLKICFPDLDEAEMELDIEQRTYTVSLRSLCIR